jgi:hypothetical protein
MNSNELLRLLGRDIGLSQLELARIASSAPFRYKHYTLKKRTGGKRDIYHPTPELKAIQWWLVTNIFAKLPVHGSVFSYRKKLSIRDHAAAHLGSKYFYRLDFTDFFPSIRSDDVCNLLQRACKTGALDFDDSAISLVARLVCRAPKGNKVNFETLALSIGAPSSPAISNAALFDLDSRLARLCREFETIYSRYADDLYFSTRRPHTLEGLIVRVRQEIASFTTPKLTINEAKTSRTSRKHRVQVTGVIITPDAKVSVGRERKRFVKSLVHRYVQGQLQPGERASLRGLVAYISSIESDFLERLNKKFGRETIEKITQGEMKQSPHFPAGKIKSD